MKAACWSTLVLLHAVPLLASPALAAGFEGGYFGVNVGGFRAKTYTEQRLDQPNVVFPADTAALIQGVATTNASPKQTSGLGGIHAGYTWRVDYLYVGLESDVNYWGYSNTAQSEQTFSVSSDRTVRSTNTSKATHLVTLRPRVGFNLSERSQLHFTAGIAYADLRHSNFTEITAETGETVTYQSSKKNKVGWVVGAGYERRWTDRLNLRLDYQYIDFGRVSATGVTADAPSGTDLDPSSVTVGYHAIVHILRLGVNWRF